MALLAHDVVIFLSWEVCYFDYPFGVIQTPIIRESCEVGRHSIRFISSFESIFRLGWLYACLHVLAEYHRSYRQYICLEGAELAPCGPCFHRKEV